MSDRSRMPVPPELPTNDQGAIVGLAMIIVALVMLGATALYGIRVRGPDPVSEWLSSVASRGYTPTALAHSRRQDHHLGGSLLPLL